MKIRMTKMEELPVVMSLYANARTFMAEHGNPNQWGTTYPEIEMIEDDIEKGRSYVCEKDGRIVATFYFCNEEDETYQHIYEGQWLDASPYGVVHRITSDGSAKGAASYCLQWAFHQCGNVKIDTHRDNQVMQNMLKKNGFVYCGIIYIESGAERLAFQKK